MPYAVTLLTMLSLALLLPCCGQTCRERFSICRADTSGCLDGLPVDLGDLTASLLCSSSGVQYVPLRGNVALID